MAKLTKQETKKHLEAEAILSKDVLTEDEKEFVLEHWQEGANHVNGAAGAFFTPLSMAYDVVLNLGFRASGRVIDLCAGIGTLAYAAWNRQKEARNQGAVPLEIVCVEVNPDYVAIGKKILPEATWICASIFDLPELGRFDHAISNPPFGRIQTDARAPRYTGSDFEFKVIDIAAELADCGVFVLPANSAPFRISDDSGYRVNESAKHSKFLAQTGIVLDVGIGIDTRTYQDEWHGVNVSTEIVETDFTERQAITAKPSRRSDQPAFDFAA